jgi:hypothetical protein
MVDNKKPERDLSISTVGFDEVGQRAISTVVVTVVTWPTRSVVFPYRPPVLDNACK